jgi:hypothetical protein
MTSKELLNKINEETILQISMPEVAIRIINEAKSEWCREFAEWVGLEYTQDEGSVIGVIYYNRDTRDEKDYTIPELYEIWLKELND